MHFLQGQQNVTGSVLGDAGSGYNYPSRAVLLLCTRETPVTNDGDPWWSINEMVGSISTICK